MAITPANVPRQTIPYADRPMVDSGGRATIDFYQYLERLRVGMAATITNVTNVIVQTDANEAQITAMLVSLATVEAEIAAIQAEIAGLTPSASEPPPPPGLPRFPVPPAPPLQRAPVFTLEMFLALDCTNAPTADPGGNRPWLKAGDWHVGA